MDLAQIKSLSDEQLISELSATYKEMMNVRFRLSTRQLDNPQELRQTKKNIARLKTIMKQRGVSET